MNGPTRDVCGSSINKLIHSYLNSLYLELTQIYDTGVKTNIGFLENVLRHPEFLSGQATTSFIERHPELFNFETRGHQQASKMLNYLADLVGLSQGFSSAFDMRSLYDLSKSYTRKVFMQKGQDELENSQATDSSCIASSCMILSCMRQCCIELVICTKICAFR